MSRLHSVDLFTGIGGITLGFEWAGIDPIVMCEWDEDCTRVLDKHWPDVRKEKDVRNFDASEFRGRADIVTGGFPCFPAGTLILTLDGFVNVEDIKEGDLVLTHLNRWRKVTKTMSRESNIVKMKGHGHPRLFTTEEHPFWSSSYRYRSYKSTNNKRLNERVFEEPRWVEAKDMRGRFWASPAVFPPSSIPQIERRGREHKLPEIGEDFLWVLGAYVGDGCLYQGPKSGRPDQIHSAVHICCEPNSVDELKKHLDLAGLKATKDTASDKKLPRYVLSSLPLGRFIEEHFGRLSGGKRIPSWLLGLPENLKRAFLEGYVWADGCHLANGQTKITTINKNLAIGSKLIAQSLGYSVALHFNETEDSTIIEGRRVNQKPWWQVVIEKRARSSHEMSGHRFGLVRKVLKTDDVATVYNFEVEEDNSYVADGIVVHNCQGLSVAASAIRKGLADERSNLFFELVRVVDEVRPKYVVWENVPGLISSWSGSPDEISEDGEWEENSDLLTVMETFRSIGYTGGYRVVDSRYFGVPQRRRRVFGVFSRGFSGWRRAGAILLDPDGGEWTPPKGNEEIDSDLDGVAHCLKASGGYKGCVTHETYVAVGVPPPHGIPCGVHANQRGELRTSTLAGSFTASRSGKQFEGVAVVCPPPDAEGEGEATGVPGWVDVGPKALDSIREKQLGNAVTTMVAYYFGRRIVQLEDFLSRHPELDPEN